MSKWIIGVDTENLGKEVQVGIERLMSSRFGKKRYAVLSHVLEKDDELYSPAPGVVRAGERAHRIAKEVGGLGISYIRIYWSYAGERWELGVIASADLDGPLSASMLFAGKEEIRQIIRSEVDPTIEALKKMRGAYQKVPPKTMRLCQTLTDSVLVVPMLLTQRLHS